MSTNANKCIGGAFILLSMVGCDLESGFQNSSRFDAVSAGGSLYRLDKKSGEIMKVEGLSLQAITTVLPYPESSRIIRFRQKIFQDLVNIDGAAKAIGDSLVVRGNIYVPAESIRNLPAVISLQILDDDYFPLVSDTWVQGSDLTSIVDSAGTQSSLAFSKIVPLKHKIASAASIISLTWSTSAENSIKTFLTTAEGKQWKNGKDAIEAPPKALTDSPSAK